MDIALELTDTYIFDYLYSWALPVKSPFLNGFGDQINGTAFDAKSASTWQYHPSNSFLQFEPTEAAYTSQLNRDNIYRQAFSLFLITWYVQCDRQGTNLYITYSLIQ